MSTSMKRLADQDIISPNTRRPRLSHDQDDTLAEDTIIIEEGEVWEQRKKTLLGLGTGSPDLYACFLSAISLVRRHFSETDNVGTKTGLKFKGIFDLESEKWECHMSHPSSTTTFESGPFARQDHATCWVAFVACRELRLGFPSIGLNMDGQPANALAYVGGKLMKMIYAIEGFVNLPRSSEDSPSASYMTQFVKITVACAYYRGGFYLALAVASGVIGPMEGINAWGDLARKYHQPPVPKPHMTISNSELHVVEGILGYSFGEKSILSESLIHKSVPGAVKETFAYERLEFLGDAVLEFLAMLYFLSRKQQIDGRDLSKNVSSSTNNAALGSLCIELQYYRHLQHRGLEAHIANGKQVFLSKKPQPCYWSSWTKSSIPKVCFANIIESAFGAVFLDSGFNLEAARGVFGNVVCPFYNRNFPRV
ncbi:hypothetical protein BGZ80_000586 [Entomortierella chlamydospora]|uniref:RNase III domain-containing protein n=1 Tax=Entomortierella chlamydospora TaxID=101097 RepID=A0A9P6MSV0_9FUNG|nr:hypothetical protein BGZ80_000586 [Entomortierella chlamydospora]